MRIMNILNMRDPQLLQEQSTSSASWREGAPAPLLTCR
jgi:hypothetical protein